jgi:hypothetical protein
MSRHRREESHYSDPAEITFHTALNNLRQGLSIPILASSPAIPKLRQMIGKISLVSDRRFMKAHIKRSPGMTQQEIAAMVREYSGSFAVHFYGDTPEQDVILIRRDLAEIASRQTGARFYHMERTASEEISHGVGYVFSTTLADLNDSSQEVLPYGSPQELVQRFIIPARQSVDRTDAIDPQAIIIKTRGFDLVYIDGTNTFSHRIRKQMDEMRAIILRTIITSAIIAAKYYSSVDDPYQQFIEGLNHFQRLYTERPDIYHKEGRPLLFLSHYLDTNGDLLQLFNMLTQSDFPTFLQLLRNHDLANKTQLVFIMRDLITSAQI